MNIAEQVAIPLVRDKVSEAEWRERVNLAVLVFVVEAGERPLESTIVKVTVNVPLLLGVPLREPPAEMLMLAGSPVADQLIGAVPAKGVIATGP